MYRTRQRGYALSVMFCVTVALVTAGITAVPFGLSPFKEKSGKSTEAANDGDYRVGAIIFEIDPYPCEELKFDNFTGRFSEARPCDSKVVGADGKPLATGAFDRIESIRNSFAGSRQFESGSAVGD